MPTIKTRRDAIAVGRYFYANEDPRSLCLAIADCDGTRIITTYINRTDAVFHVHMETGSLGYMKADTTVIAADHLNN